MIKLPHQRPFWFCDEIRPWRRDNLQRAVINSSKKIAVATRLQVSYLYQKNYVFGDHFYRWIIWLTNESKTSIFVWMCQRRPSRMDWLWKDKSGMRINNGTHNIVANCANPRWISFIWHTKTLAAARNSAVPSMLMLQPIGSTKRVMRGSIRSGPSMHRKVTGRAAALER